MEVPKIYPRSSEINFKAIRSFNWEGDVLSVTDGIVNAFRGATDREIVGHYQVDCTELREFLEAKQAGKELRPVVRGKWEDTLYGWKCTACGEEQQYARRLKLCPNCGAEMRQ